MAAIKKSAPFSFDGCSNYCVGQARAVARPAIVIPDQRVNPAQVTLTRILTPVSLCCPQARQPLPGLEVVAAARERCVDKIEQVEEIEYDEVVSLLVVVYSSLTVTKFNLKSHKKCIK